MHIQNQKVALMGGQKNLELACTDLATTLSIHCRQHISQPSVTWAGIISANSILVDMAERLHTTAVA